MGRKYRALDHIFYQVWCGHTSLISGSMISGALQVAVDDVNADPELLPNHKLTYTYNNTCGDEQQSFILFRREMKH